MQVRPLFVLLAPMLLFLSGLFSPAFCVQHQMLSEGGPYLSTGSREIEKFTAKIVVPSKFLNQPVWITFYNGYKTRPGYNWVRVFLSRDGENPQSGNILVDEHTFLNTHAKSVDLTGQLQESGNVLFIEGVGRKGAEFCWVLSSVPSNLSIVNVSKVVPGKQFLIHGTGFSGNANENIVMLGNKRLTVHGVENGILTVEAPADLDDKNSQLSVEVNGTRSNPMAVSMGVMPPPSRQPESVWRACRRSTYGLWYGFLQGPRREYCQIGFLHCTCDQSTGERTCLQGSRLVWVHDITRYRHH